MITEKHCDEINGFLEENGAAFRFALKDGENSKWMEVIPSSSKFLLVDRFGAEYGNAQFALSDEFIDYLKDYFKKEGLNLNHNSNATIFWANDKSTTQHIGKIRQL